MTPDEQRRLFERWTADHPGILFHVARGFAAGADADDLMQELLLALWRAVPAFRGESSVATFMHRVAHHAALTWRRTHANYRRRVDGFAAEVGDRPPPPPPQTARRDAELLEFLYAHIRRLPPLDRSLILLQLDGLSYAEIATIHGLTESNVGVRLARLKQRLTAALQEITHELR